MNLKSYLQQVEEKRIKDLTAHHGIYYNSNFSRCWISKQIIKKLDNHIYLKKLITQKLDQSSTQLLSKLLKTGSINKNSLNLNSYYNLKEYGLIYERNNFCYLFPQLKSSLKHVLSATTSKTNNSQAKKFKVQDNFNTKKKACELSFFHYLVLTMAKIEQISQSKSQSLNKKNLVSFLKKINSTSFSPTVLLEKLFEYGSQQSLIAKNLTITPKFKTWLETSYKQKILSAINIFFPQSESALRKIIAVLSHYPLAKQIPLEFAQEELQLQTINQSQQELLALLKIIKINNQKITLIQEAWQHFNPQVKFKFKTPKNKQQKIIVTPTTKLEQLWSIATKNKLLSVTDNLIFKQSHN